MSRYTDNVDDAVYHGMNGSPQRVSDLADELGVGRLRVFNALKRLQKSGWA